MERSRGHVAPVLSTTLAMLQRSEPPPARPAMTTFSLPQLVVLLGLVLAPRALADRLVTKDGRVIDVQRAKIDGDSYRLTFASGEIVVAAEHVASVEVEGDMSDYVPKDEREREFLAKGYVRFRGKWQIKSAYEAELAKDAEARRKRADELAHRSKFVNGWRQESKHFTWQSNTSPEILRRYVDLLEAHFELLDSRMGIKPGPVLARTKMHVNVFKRQSEMIAHAKDEDIDESTLGYFSSSDQTLNFFHDYKDPARSEVTALHECTHLLTYLLEPNYLPQIWINEAVADYFGASEVTVVKGKLVIWPGKLEEDSILTVQQAIAAKTHLGLEQLMLQERDNYDGIHYAHGWSFVYFLQSQPKYAKTFNKFFRDVYALELKEAKAEMLETGLSDKSGLRRQYKPEDLRDALVKRLSVKDLATLEKEWLAFVSGVKIEGARARFLRGSSTVFAGGDAKQAKEDLDAAIAGGYVQPDAYWARGYARLSTDDHEGALEDLRKAVELAPLDAVYRADLAWGLTGWWGAESEGIRGDDGAQSEAEAQFGLAAELDPENDEFVELAKSFRAARQKK